MSLRSQPRTVKACEECRKAKKRCEGNDYPCARCSAFMLQCLFRQRLRRRPGAAQLSSDTSQVTPSEHSPSRLSPDSYTQPIVKVPLGEVFRMIRISQLTPVGVSEALIGPTSNFAALYHLYTVLYPYTLDSSDNMSILLGDQILEYFHYRSLVFTQQCCSPSRVPLSASLPEAPSIPKHLASQFLDMYSTTLLHLLPFYQVDHLKAILCSLYGIPVSFSITATDLANLFTILAIGSTCTTYSAHGDYLYQVAGYYAEKGYNFHNNQEEQACQGLASASHKLCIIGFNPVEPPRGHSHTTPSEMKTIILAAAALERWICGLTGRSFSISDKPNFSFSDCGILSPMSKICDILSQAQKTHEKFHGDLPTLCALSRSFNQRLDSCLAETIIECRNALDTNPIEQEHTLFLTSIMYHYAIVIVFRPFVILRMRNRGITQTVASPRDQESPNGPVDLSQLCETCIQSSRRIISSIYSQFKSGSRVKDLTPNAFFMETACFTLILDSLSAKSITYYTPFLEKGLYCLSNMACQRVDAPRLAAPRLASIRAAMSAIGLDRGSYPSDPFQSPSFFEESDSFFVDPISVHSIADDVLSFSDIAMPPQDFGHLF